MSSQKDAEGIPRSFREPMMISSFETFFSSDVGEPAASAAIVAQLAQL